MNNEQYDPQITRSMHDLFIPSDGGEKLLDDHSTTSGRVTVHFREHTKKCVEFIEKYDVIVGSVAWFTSMPVIQAMAKKTVQIVVQKEDFLRPDSERQDLHAAYSSLWWSERRDFGGVLATMSEHGDTTIEAVRCVGNHNAEKIPSFPRAHHKFLVGCSRSSPHDSIKPKAVWTGSFNLTANAERSFENVVVIEDETIAQAYYNEWNQLAALSEPLDWESEWCQPQWRIGT
jgi:hypothetical protein